MVILLVLQGQNFTQRDRDIQGNFVKNNNNNENLYRSADVNNGDVKVNTNPEIKTAKKQK